MSTFVRCSYVILNAYTGKEKSPKSMTEVFTVTD